MQAVPGEEKEKKEFRNEVRTKNGYQCGTGERRWGTESKIRLWFSRELRGMARRRRRRRSSAVKLQG